ncbi:MAG: sel1 repeat family protein [Parachlamydiaceae bacterium]|nr:MAG: sel1 repeat family protein [Parachlamydiaceae bacterium]
MHEAERWLKSAASQGDIIAQRQLALMYILKNKKPIEAVKYLKRAANQGDAPSQFLLGKSF